MKCLNIVLNFKNVLYFIKRYTFNSSLVYDKRGQESAMSKWYILEPTKHSQYFMHFRPHLYQLGLPGGLSVHLSLNISISDRWGPV